MFETFFVIFFRGSNRRFVNLRKAYPNILRMKRSFETDAPLHYPLLLEKTIFFPGTALSTSLSRSTRSALYLDETLVDFPSFTKIMYNHVWKRKDVACKKTWFFFYWPWLILYIQLNNFPRQCLIWAYSFISDRLSDIEPAIFFYDCVAKQRFPSVKPVDHVFSVIEF